MASSRLAVNKVACAPVGRLCACTVLVLRTSAQAAAVIVSRLFQFIKSLLDVGSGRGANQTLSRGCYDARSSLTPFHTVGSRDWRHLGTTLIVRHTILRNMRTSSGRRKIYSITDRVHQWLFVAGANSSPRSFDGASP